MSALSASAIFDAIAPGYAADAAKSSFLQLADLRTSTSFNEKYNLAVA